MSEMVAESKVLQVFMICDKCGKGEMRPTGEALMSNPPKYPHKCIVCGNIANFPYHYPYQRLVTIEKAREAVGNEANPDEPL